MHLGRLLFRVTIGSGSGWALAALAAGAAGSAATIQFGGSTPQPGPEAAQQAAEVTSAPAPAA
jgi:hypothetical protein